MITCYILYVTDLPADQCAALLEQILDQPIESYLMSTANRLRQEGRTQGRAEGKAEGRAEGKAEVLAESRSRLLRQLAARFGAVPADVTERVQRASSEDLDLWSIRLLAAPSAAEVLAAK